MIENILKTLGFNQEEIKIYLSLLEVGPTTAGSFAKIAGIPRPSLYGYFRKLQNKGVITQTIKDGVKTFVAESPSKINSLFQQKIESLQDKQKSFQSLLPDLEKARSSKLITPKFQLFEGEQGLQHILKDMLLYSNMETQAFWPIRKMVEILSSDFFHYFNKRRVRNNLYIRAIWPIGEIVDIKKHPYLGVGAEFKREIRVAPRGTDFSMGYWIYGNKAAFISSRVESFGFIVESKELAEMLLAQFEIIWKMSKPIEVNPKDAESFLKELSR